MEQTLGELLRECESLHGHLCPGQVLGVRMALHGCELIGIEEPKGADRKRLLVWVEIDRCVTDAVSAVTGVRLGKRSLKFLDYGKVAATFFNVETRRGVRIVALESARTLAEEKYSQLQSRKDRQMLTYRLGSLEELFKVEHVVVELNEFDLPGRPRSRVICQSCSEAVNDGKEVALEDGGRVCRGCAFGSYYRVESAI